ncbi:hypothetical protein NC653_022542 [Populus alba x Populus x berolinensis]|uniref:BHLH domain-containing protein n=1 Tax=Populus alba x Populus x berolinensis TaxID=444605 RepID=A0AAD6Q9T8_9ROSI|nr:hypothetical protein NC653_022542 [Populus alba x Populus x berolinensis]
MIKQLRQQIKPSMEELPGLEFGTTSCTDLIQEQQGTTSLISFAVELQRRGQLNDNYKTLRNLIKNPSTKEDRATVIRDAIKYIIQLIRAVYELKQLVEKKRQEIRYHRRGFLMSFIWISILFPVAILATKPISFSLKPRLMEDLRVLMCIP